MVMSNWVVRRADNAFVRGGFLSVDADPATEIAVSFPEGKTPDPILERYDATSATLRRPATQAELDAVAAAQKDSDIDNMKALRALARAIYEQLPVASRPATFQAFADRIKTIYRAL
jgi:acyl-CoA reductase-like NAD-dependent aldehyde dehydrogenase